VRPVTEPEPRVAQLLSANEVLQRQVHEQAVEIRNADLSRQHYQGFLGRLELARDEALSRLRTVRAEVQEQANRIAELTAEVETLRAQERLMGERDRATGRLLSESYRRGWGDGAAATQKALREMAVSLVLPPPGDRPQHACTCIRTAQLPDHRPANAACNLTRYHRAMEGRAMS
jgi:hypothetical protein